MSYKGVYFLGPGLASSTLTGLNWGFGVSAEEVVFSWVGGGVPDADRNVRAPSGARRAALRPEGGALGKAALCRVHGTGMGRAESAAAPEGASGIRARWWYRAAAARRAALRSESGLAVPLRFKGLGERSTSCRVRLHERGVWIGYSGVAGMWGCCDWEFGRCRDAGLLRLVFDTVALRSEGGATDWRGLLNIRMDNRCSCRSRQNNGLRPEREFLSFSAKGMRISTARICARSRCSSRNKRLSFLWRKACRAAIETRSRGKCRRRQRSTCVSGQCQKDWVWTSPRPRWCGRMSTLHPVWNQCREGRYPAPKS